MHIKLYFTTGLLFSLFLFTCKKNDGVPPVDISFLVHQWKVLSIAEQVTLETASGNYYLDFLTNKGYGLALDTAVDVNMCGGQYNVPEKGKIFLQFIGCTKVCCDSDYAKKLISVMGNLSGKNASYITKGDSLVISGVGKLILLKKN